MFIEKLLLLVSVGLFLQPCVNGMYPTRQEVEEHRAFVYALRRGIFEGPRESWTYLLNSYDPWDCSPYIHKVMQDAVKDNVFDELLPLTNGDGETILHRIYTNYCNDSVPISLFRRVIASIKNKEILKQTLYKKDKFGKTALYYACYLQSTLQDFIQQLAGIDKHYFLTLDLLIVTDNISVLHDLSDKGKTEAVIKAKIILDALDDAIIQQLLLKPDDGLTAFEKAIACGNKSVAMLLFSVAERVKCLKEMVAVSRSDNPKHSKLFQLLMEDDGGSSKSAVSELLDSV